MESLCPHCREGHSEVVGKELEDPEGLLVTFECQACGAQWTVGF